MENLLIICGPTACGKTSTSIEIAKNIGGEIICADSMQIYKYMNIGTAKVTEEEVRNVKHYLYDIVEPNESFSVSEYVVQARKIISKINENGKIPILVGGTGLYIESLIYPYSFGSAIADNKVREELYKELSEKGVDFLYNELVRIDPIDAAKIHPNNTKRLIRALEIYRITGKTKTDFNVDKKPLYNIDMNVINLPRDILYDRINKRVNIMFENGLKEEVENLLCKGCNFDMQSFQAIGYKEFKNYFNGVLSLDEVKNLIAKNSRNYAKRQVTWFKQYDFAQWLSPEECIKKYRSNNGIFKEN